MNRFIAWLLAAAGICTMLPGPGAAQSFRQPIRVVVPQAAGGGTDIVARLLAPGLSRELGRTVVVENKPGASGQIGTQQVKSSPADGSTILFAVDHSLIIVPLTTPGVRYNVEKDFVPLGQAVRTYWALSVPASAPYKDFREYVTALKRDPLARTYGVPLAGGATDVIGQAIGKHAGVQTVPVPYSGSGPVIQAVMGGQVPVGLTGLPEAMAVYRSGKAKVIAISGNARSPLLPEVPTFGELGVGGLEFHTFLGFFAPKGLPPAMAQAFNAALRKTLGDPAVLDKIRQMSLEPAPTTLEEAGREVDEASRFWTKSLAPKG